MISLVTCTYNRSKQLFAGLSTVLKQSLLPDEIVIVDDGSTDDTRTICADLNEVARAIHVNLKYIYVDHPEPRISCIPRNIGIKQATGDIIFFCEPETLHLPDNFDKMLRYMSEYSDRTILASQVWTMGSLVYKSLTVQDLLYPQRILDHKYAMLTAGNMQNTNAPDSDWAITGELHCNAGVFFATRKQWLLDIGGFDESFQGHGFDDFDLFNRLALYGHGGIVKVIDVPVIHQWHEKNYPYNIYESATSNGKISEANIHAGIYEVNKGKEWGVL